MLHEQPPAWAAKYIGVSFSAKCISGLDCWGLVRRVYLEQRGVRLPDHMELYRVGAGGKIETSAAVLGEELGRDGSPWRRLDAGEAPGLLDVALFRIMGGEWHVGLAVSTTKMLHAQAGTLSCLEPFASPLWGSRLEAWYRCEAPVTVNARDLTSAEPRRMVCAAGASLDEMVASLELSEADGVAVFVGGVEVPIESWPRVRPKAGTVVSIAVRPGTGGGGKGGSIVRIIASIGVIAAAALTPGALGLVTAASALTPAGAILSAGIAIGGTLLVNALIPAPKPKISDLTGSESATSRSIEGARNELRPWGAGVQVLGASRFAPPYGCKPYTESIGDDQFVRMLLDLGKGPLEISDIQSGDTPLSYDDDVQIEVRSGYPDDPPLTLFPAQVEEAQVGVQLTQAGGWHVETTEPDTDEISVDVMFPRGLVEFDAAGNKLARAVQVDIEYRAVGSGTWLTINGDAGTTGSPSDFRGLDYLTRTPEATFGGEGTHANDINWSGSQVPYPDAKPGYLPTAGYSWVAEGWLYAPTTGSYRFVVDGSDACDVHVDWHEVASWYGGHATEVTQATLNSSTHAGSPITLTQGWHQFRARVESRTNSVGGGALAVGWKKPGDSVFTIIPQANLSTGTTSWTNSLHYRWFTFGDYDSGIRVNDARTEVLRAGKSWAVPRGQYEVRLQRSTADSSSDRILDEVYWSVLRSITNEDPIRDPGHAKIAIRIRATDRFNGVIDDISCLAKSIVLDYAPDQFGAWLYRASTNPASLYRHVLQGPAIDQPVPDSSIDVDRLEAFHARCTALGLNFSCVVDTAETVAELLADICSAGRASYARRDHRHSVVMDVPQTVPVQHITPANSWGYQGSKAFSRVPHAMRVTFINAEKGYRSDERIVLNDGYQLEGKDAFGNDAPDLPEATDIEPIEFRGCTSAAEAWKHGRYYLANTILRPEIHSVMMDFENLVAQRGDLVLLAHDVPLFGLASGRVIGRTVAGSTLTHLQLDEEIVMETGHSYVIRVRLQDGSTFLKAIVLNPGPHHLVQFSTPVPNSEPWPDAGDLFMFGELDRETYECVIKSIEPDADFSARLTLVAHAPEVHLADQGEIPPFDSGISDPTDYEYGPDTPVIESIRSDDSVMVRDADGSLRNRMLITLKRPSGNRPKPTDADVKIRPKPPTGEPGTKWTTVPRQSIDGSQVSVLDVEEGITYQLKLRVITHTGYASDWISAEHTVVGKVLPPPDVVSFDVRRLSDGTREYTWDLGDEPPDVAGVLIRYGAVGSSWSAMTPLTASPVEGASPWQSELPPTGGLRRYAVKMVDTSGNESPDMVWVERDLGDGPRENVVISEDARRMNWPGTRGSCFVTTGNVLEANDSTTWATLPTTWAGWSRWNLNPASPISYTHPVIDAGIAFDFEPTAYALADGTAVVDVAYSDSTDTPTNWTAIATLAGKTVHAQWFIFRVTVTASVAQPVPVIRELLCELRAPIKIVEINDLDTSTLDSTRRDGPGDIRLPIPRGMFTQVRRVSLSFNGSGQGRTWEVLDKDPDLGPRVRLYDTFGASADGTIDAAVRGL